MLKEVAARLMGLVQGRDLVARIANFQFGLILPQCDRLGAENHARRIFDALRTPFSIAGINYEIGAIVGSVSSPTDANNAVELIRKADIALSQAKDQGHSYAHYDLSRDQYNPRRLVVLGEFRESLDAGQLHLYCQPKVNMQNNRVVGVEALVRWKHPVLGMISPEQFIAYIEPTDLVHSLTRFMLQKAVQQSVEWRDQGIQLPIAINLSPRNLVEPDFFDYLEGLLTDAQIEPGMIGLELTESAIISDAESAIRELEKLCKIGVPLFIDDFGTGYSSLTYLTSLPAHAIKIDHSFTLQLLESQTCSTLVRSTIDLAHSLNMKVIAEGAATKEIMDELVRFKCDEAQGYYISPPIPSEQIAAWLTTSSFH